MSTLIPDHDTLLILDGDPVEQDVEGRIIVGLHEFAKFSRRMDHHLARLVVRWSPMAAPKAILAGRKDLRDGNERF